MARDRWLTVGLGLLLAMGSAASQPITSVAQSGCTPETEPDDAPEQAAFLTGHVCIEGTLPDGDQDLFLWEVSAAEAATGWMLTLDGVGGTLTGLEVLPVTSDPGVTPLSVGNTLLTVSSDPLADGPITRSDVLLPSGRYLLGMTRSSLPDGSSPTAVDYSFSIEPGLPLPASADAEPNDDATTATPISGAFSLSGDGGASVDVYAWTVSQQDAGRAWQLDALGQVGVAYYLTLTDTNGDQVASESPDPFGGAHLYDLRLAAGTYLVSLSNQGDGIHPYALASTVVDLGQADPEPNDDIGHALALDPVTLVAHGRLARAGDVDDYRLTVDDLLAAVQVDITLLSRGGESHQLCLLDLQDAPLQCRSGEGDSVLRGLLLSAGEYVLQVSGDSGLTDPYVLRIDPTNPPAPDFETEPNDTPSTATRFEAGITMRGHQTDSDPDLFAVSVSGPAQLWQLDATGDHLSQLRWSAADGSELASADVASDGSSATLTDMYLIPGPHWLRIDGSGDYGLRLTPLGPPQPGSEREPNNVSDAAEPLLVGDARNGRLPGPNDIDVFRLSLAAPEHIRIAVDPPADGAVAFALMVGDEALARMRTPEVGQPLAYDAQLPAGDYEIWLSSGTPSAGRYHLTVGREDPFAFAEDQEPDDTATEARPLALDHELDGTAWAPYDEDWYQLDPLPEGTTQLRIEASGDVSSVQLSDGTDPIELVPDASGSAYTADAPPTARPLYLQVVAVGDYRLRASDGSASASAPETVSEQLPATLSVRLDSPSVAAYWPAGQRITGRATIADAGDRPLELDLDTATSHYLWSVALEQTHVSVPAGGTVDVPFTVLAQPDTWADVPVRVTVRAQDSQGEAVTGFVELTPSRDALPSGPVQSWSVPDELLGGLDVASLALGGQPVASVDADLEAQLHDGVTPSGDGFGTSFTNGQPLFLTVDLAGDQPIPVAGTILDPQARSTPFDGVPHHFALLLSQDGTDYQVALEGDLSPLPIDQAFALSAPIPARFAQLRIDSVYGSPSAGSVVLGEWKVVAVPGVSPTSDPLNIADPRRGGHVVWMDPQSADLTFPDTLIDEDPSRQTLPAEPGTLMSWAIGFQDDRVARVEELQWVDAPDTDPTMRFDKVDVAVSTDSAIGPWRDVGTWTLDRATDGSVAAFTFDPPLWARFVRFSGKAVPKGGYAAEEPATLRILETPSDATYRSVLGEWGQTDPKGPYEWLQPPDVSTPPAIADRNDTPEFAQPLAAQTRVSDRVQAEHDLDWYALTIPAGQNSVSFTVGGEPSVGVSLSLVDSSGSQVPMTLADGEAPGTVTYTAGVVSGASYRVMVEQPPFSAVVTFDTSGSMGNYLSFVTQALRSYADGVTKGQEAIQVVPFEEQPLLADWSDDPYVLGNAVASYVPGDGSSSAEAALLDATKLLTGHEGARAILLVTDGETSSFDKNTQLWGQLASVRPVIFAVHVGGDSQPVQSRHFMQDWADAAGGFYQYARSHAEIDRAFDRMATWLRRPAAYTLSYTTSVEQVPPPAPGSLSVVSWPDANGRPSQPTVGKDVAIEIILDTSGSMLTPFGGKRRIDVAKDAFDSLVGEDLPAGVPLALRVFGDRSDPCATQLAVPFGPLDPKTVTALVDSIDVVQEADTPIAAALLRTPADLARSSGSKIVLLITDSEETWPNKDLCGRDPAAAIRKIRREGISSVNIIGLAVKDRQATQTMRKWARSGNGAFFTARDLGQLAAAVRSAVSAPYGAFDASGALVASGVVNAAPVQVPPGSYRVVVSSDPEVTFEAIAVESDQSVTVTMPSAKSAPDAVPSQASGTSTDSSPEGAPIPSAAPSLSP